MAESGPDELYTLRAQYQLGHYALALAEARQVARRPMPAALKQEREEYQMRAHAALQQYDKCVAQSGDGPGASAFVVFVCSRGVVRVWACEHRLMIVAVASICILCYICIFVDVKTRRVLTNVMVHIVSNMCDIYI